MINREDILIRCSSIHLIMQNGKSATKFSDANQRDLDKLQSSVKPLNDNNLLKLKKLLDKKQDSTKIELSDTCKSYLRGLYLISKYGNRYSFLGKPSEGISQMVRGVKQEDFALQMLSAFRGKKFFRNKGRLKNEYLIGSVDVFDNKEISKAKLVVELKTKATIPDFNKLIGTELDKEHKLQVQGYLSLTGKDLAEVVYCLVPPTESVIQEQKELFYNLDKNKKNNNVDKNWAEIENNIRFNDIPLNEKIISFKSERDNKIIDQIHERVEICRDWILDFEKYHIDWLNQNK